MFRVPSNDKPASLMAEYIVMGVIALGLAGYLGYALMRPDRF